MITRILHKISCSTAVFFGIALVVPGMASAAGQVGRVVVLLDATSTMSAPCGTMSRFDVARWCLSDVLDLTPGGTPFCFAIAGNGGHSIETFDAMSPDVRGAVRRKVMRINPSGTTSLASCFADPRMIVQARPDQTTLVVLITDGQACEIGPAAAAVTHWQKVYGRPVHSIVVGPCTESRVVSSLSQFSASCGATFTQCPTAQRLHEPLIKAFQICYADCGPTRRDINEVIIANQLQLSELKERLDSIERNAARGTRSLSQLNAYVGATGDENSPLTRAIFGKFAPHIDENKDSIEAGHVSLQELKEGIRKTARFIGYDADAESLRSVNDKIQTDTALIKEILARNEQLITRTTAELKSDIDEVQKIDDEFANSLASTKWGAGLLAILAVLFSGTTAAGGTWGFRRLLSLVGQQDPASAATAAGAAVESRMNEQIACVLESLSAAETRMNEQAARIETQATENNRQAARVLESLSALDNQLGERVRLSVAGVVEDHAKNLREAGSQDRQAVTHAVEKNEAALRSVLQTSFETQRDRLGAAITDGAKSVQEDISRLEQTIENTATRSSDLLGRVTRRLKKCTASVTKVETAVRKKSEGLKEQVAAVSNRGNEWNANTAQQLDQIKQSLSGLNMALSGEAGRVHRDAQRVATETTQTSRDEPRTAAETQGQQTKVTNSGLQTL